VTVSELHKCRFRALETERLLLRPLAENDAPAMFEYTSAMESFRFLRRSPHVSVEEDREFIASVLTGYQQHREFVWGICLRGADRVIGSCRLFDISPEQGCCEVSYLLHPAYQNRGITSEAVRRLIQYAFFDLGLQIVKARCAVSNCASEAVMRKCGMERAALLPHHAELHGIWHDFLLYDVTRETKKI